MMVQDLKQERVLSKSDQTHASRQEENAQSVSNYSFSGDQRYLLQEDESKLSPSPSPGDASESGSFLNFRIKLQPMDQDQERESEEG